MAGCSSNQSLFSSSKTMRWCSSSGRSYSTCDICLLCGLQFTLRSFHRQTVKGARSSLFVFDWKHPMPVLRRLNLTHSDFSNLRFNSEEETSVMHAWNFMVLFFHHVYMKKIIFKLVVQFKNEPNIKQD